MTINALLEYGGWIVVLYIAAEATLAGFVKPIILQPLRLRLDALHVNAYKVAVKVALFIVGCLAASPWIHQLDIFARWLPDAPVLVGSLGLKYSPWFGVVPSVLLMTIIGEWLHDYFKENEIALPGIQKRNALPEGLTDA